MSLWKFSSRELRGRPGRAVLTLLSVVLGVAAVVSVALATTTTRAAYKQMYVALTGTAAFEVSAEGGGPIDEEVLPIVEAVPGVKSAIPVVQQPRNLYFNQNRVKVLAMGIDPDKENALRDYELTQGKMIQDTGDVLITEDFAKTQGLQVGDEVRLQSNTLKPIPMTVTGLLKPRGANALNQGILMLHLDRAQPLFKRKGQFDSIYVVLTDEAENDKPAMEAEINAKLPSGVFAHPPTARTDQADEIMRSSEHGLFMTSALSLVMAAFIILNTFYMNVGERRRQLAIMRAVGATRRQIMRMLLREGLLMGIMGTILGTGLGVVGAHYLSQVMQGIFQYHVALQFRPEPFLIGAGFGVGVSFLAALLPAYRAGQVSPLEGMRTLATEEVEGVPRWIFVLGFLVLIVSGVILTLCVFNVINVEYSVASSIFMLFGSVALIPLVIEPFTNLAGRVIRPLLHYEAVLACRQILRRRIRATLTVGVLFVSITAGISIANTVMNHVRDVKQWHRSTMVSDFLIRAAMPDFATGDVPDMPREIDAKIRALPGVASMDSIRYFQAKSGESSVLVITRDFTLQEAIPLAVRAGDAAMLRDKLEAGEAAVGTVLAERIKAKVGDEISITTGEQTHKLRVAATVNEYFSGGLVIYMQTQAARKTFHLSGVSAYSVKAKPQSRAAVESALRALCDQYEILLQSTAEIGEMIDNIMSGVVGSLWVILALGFTVAAFGVVNTLTMNVLEQTREIGMLRVIAMTRDQVRKTILAQATLMGLVGLAPGIIAGVTIAYLMNLVTLPVFGHEIEFVLHPALLAGCFFGGLLIILIAAWLPARRAAHLDLATALRRE